MDSALARFAALAVSLVSSSLVLKFAGLPNDIPAFVGGALVFFIIAYLLMRYIDIILSFLISSLITGFIMFKISATFTFIMFLIFIVLMMIVLYIIGTEGQGDYYYGYSRW